MKKIGLYFLIFFITAYNTSMYELAKLPAFFSHYTEHAALDRSIGLSDFVAMHYLGKDRRDNDDKKDNQLPFKHYHQQSHPNLLFIPVNPYVSLVYIVAENIIPIPYLPDFVPETAASIYFRPPCC